jgi:hypothetical protein
MWIARPRRIPCEVFGFRSMPEGWDRANRTEIQQ